MKRQFHGQFSHMSQPSRPTSTRAQLRDDPERAVEICGSGCTGTRPGPPGVFLPVLSVGRDRTAVGLVCCEVRLCDPCASVSRVCPGSPQCLFTGTGTCSVGIPL